jgi:hypothetical protein
MGVRQARAAGRGWAVSAAKASVHLVHKSGPVKIDVTAADPKVAAYITNRIKEIFDMKKTNDPLDSLRDFLGTRR